MSTIGSEVNYLTPMWPPITSRDEMRHKATLMNHITPAGTTSEFDVLSLRCDASAGPEPCLISVQALQRVRIGGQDQVQEAYGIGTIVRQADGKYRLCDIGIVQASAGLHDVMNKITAAEGGEQ